METNTTIDGYQINDTDVNKPNYEQEFIYDRLYIRIIFITLYTVVFCLCFFGKYVI